MKIMINKKKIIILGGPGSGKSVLAANLGAKLNMQVHHVDAIHVKYKDLPNGEKKRNKKILEILKEDNWIIDGNYIDTLIERIDASDFIIYLDYPSHILIKNVLLRSLKNKGIEKFEIPGVKEKLKWYLLKKTILWNMNKRKFLYKILENYKNKKILIFKNRKKLNEWYKKNFNDELRRY